MLFFIWVELSSCLKVVYCLFFLRMVVRFMGLDSRVGVGMGVVVVWVWVWVWVRYWLVMVVRRKSEKWMKVICCSWMFWVSGLEKLVKERGYIWEIEVYVGMFWVFWYRLFRFSKDGRKLLKGNESFVGSMDWWGNICMCWIYLKFDLICLIVWLY